jgi:hypothetical protein
MVDFKRPFLSFDGFEFEWMFFDSLDEARLIHRADKSQLTIAVPQPTQAQCYSGT